ncbi:malonyl-ACP O-methyltransferase BioC [Microbulbifer bruguierae]|uniref:Malonyl-[acyl-carrier protein] O-methyltransferase n=1 Tax=Microbulbifer bruguierae TaxID=3029061 RepID=A0ABY8ND39_9GAMM|nr:malonyl-ACP O-methyltransferase BioC [Microbulbifer bruguierae]WGL15677.1 malonyl-ACP O-methyltransferase BioC [Microbulbifer bruguierae]
MISAFGEMTGEIKNIALIHGWGGDSRSWQPLLKELKGSSNVVNNAVNIELPGFGSRTQEPWPDTETLLAQLETQLPENCLLLGWSLGGMLAVRLAAASKKVRALVTIATNGSFVAREDWPGMAEEIFAEFCRAQRAMPEKNWQRFCGLEARGDSEMRGLLKTLKGWQPSSVPESWSQALECLGNLDNREILSAIAVPALHILGEGDALVPVAAASKLESRCGLEKTRAVKVIAGTGHCPHLSRPREIATLISEFIRPEIAESAPLEKSSVARAFGRAAQTYDAAAYLQRAVCRELLNRAGEGWSPQRILDLGSGTGYGCELLRKRFPDAQIIALDLAPEMLAYAREHRPLSNAYVAADAEQLPLADNSFDLVFSSFALQWCYRLPQLFAEIRRVMAPAGNALISTLVPGTLKELENSWAAVDGNVHVNRFLPAEDWRAACVANQLECLVGAEQRALHFDNVKTLMRELKSIGAHNVNREAGKGLLSRSKLRKLTDAYEQQRTAAGLPATYQVLYLQLAQRQSNAAELDTAVSG